jgi:hypothetical protein
MMRDACHWLQYAENHTVGLQLLAALLWLLLLQKADAAWITAASAMAASVAHICKAISSLGNEWLSWNVLALLLMPGEGKSTSRDVRLRKLFSCWPV